jgi:hypothetical protein
MSAFDKECEYCDASIYILTTVRLVRVNNSIMRQRKATVTTEQLLLQKN